MPLYRIFTNNPNGKLFMYLNLFKLILFIFDVFTPLFLLGYGYYYNNQPLFVAGKIWYGFNLFITFCGLVRMWAAHNSIKRQYAALQGMDPTNHDLSEITVPTDIAPILYSKIFTYCIGIFSISILIYTKTYIYLILYILCTTWFQDLINKFNIITTKLNREFQRCRELKGVNHATKTTNN
mgnify:FL=1